MYGIEYLPLALEDLRKIASYISCELANPSAADRLSAKIVDSINSLSAMPYRKRVYQSIKPLLHEVRALRIDNYLVFYWVEEEPEQAVAVARVLYAKADIGRRIDAGL